MPEINETGRLLIRGADGETEFYELCGDTRIGRAEDMDLVEAVVRPDSRMVGREIVGLRLRARYDADILAVSRQGRAFRGRMGKFRFRPGDLVLFYGPRDAMPDMIARLGCLILEQRTQFGESSRRQAQMSIAVFAAAVALATTCDASGAPTARLICRVKPGGDNGSGLLALRNRT